MCCFLGLYAAGAFMPVLVGVSFPLAGIAVGMIAAGCWNRTGFHDIAALGAFLMLRTSGGRRCCGVGDPVAGGMCCFLGLYAAGTFKPVLISTGLPLAGIAVGMIGFQYALADGAFLMLRTVSGSRCSGVDDPVAGGMSGLSVPENRPAAIHFAYFPMVRCIRLPLAACNMGRYLTDMFIGPVIFPFVAHHTAAMVTACRNAVCFTAILAQTAEFADRTAFGAGLTALHTNSRAVFAGVAAFTQGSAVGAIFLTILAQGRAVTATPAVMAQRGAVFTGAAIGAEHAAFTAVGAAAFADGRAISAVFFAPTAQRYTVFTITAILTQLGAVCTGAAIGADGTALTAGTAADGADLSAGCTVIAGLAETLRLLQTFLTSGAVLVLIDGAFNAHFAVCADITALGIPGSRRNHRLHSRRRIPRRLHCFLNGSAGRDHHSLRRTCRRSQSSGSKPGSQHLRYIRRSPDNAYWRLCRSLCTFCILRRCRCPRMAVDGIIVYIAGAASLAGCTVF